MYNNVEVITDESFHSFYGSIQIFTKNLVSDSIMCSKA